MYAQVEKPKDNKNRVVGNSVTQKKCSGSQGLKNTSMISSAEKSPFFPFNNSSRTVIQRIWNSQNTWNEQNGDALKRIFTVIGNYPLFFEAGSQSPVYFRRVSHEATWVSVEVPYNDQAIFHFTVNIDLFAVKTEKEEKVGAFDADVTVQARNFHITVRGNEDASQFQAEGDLDKENLVKLKIISKKMNKAAKAYKKEFIDKKENKGKFDTWDKLQPELKRRFATEGARGYKNPPDWLLTSAESDILEQYQNIQSKSLHSGVLNKGKLSGGNKSNSESAANHLQVELSSGLNIPVIFNNFKTSLSQRLKGQVFELPIKEVGTKTIYVKNAIVE